MQVSPLNGTDSNNRKHLGSLQALHLHPRGSSPGTGGPARASFTAQEPLGARGLSLVTPEGHGNWNPVRAFYINHRDRVTGRRGRRYVSPMFRGKTRPRHQQTFPKFQRIEGLQPFLSAPSIIAQCIRSARRGERLGGVKYANKHLCNNGVGCGPSFLFRLERRRNQALCGATSKRPDGAVPGTAGASH